MNKFIGVLILFLTSVLHVNAQFTNSFNMHNEKFPMKYKSFVGNEEEIVRAWYHYVVTYSTTEKCYILRQFYPEKNLLLSETRYNDKKLKEKNGMSKSLIYTNNNVREGKFAQNLEEGEWTVKNTNGEILAKYAYNHGKREGEGLFWYGKDSLERKEYYSEDKKTGKWIYFSKKGVIAEEKNYLNDKLEGESIAYDSLGSVKTIDIYKNGELVSSTGTKETYDEKNPYFKGNCTNITDSVLFEKCNIQAFYKYIGSAIKYPKEAQKYNVSGKIFLKFSIEKDGTIGNIEALNGLCQSLEDEAVRIIKEMPNWEPGYQNGKVVRVYYSIPISFALE